MTERLLAVDGVFTSWSDWEACDVSCGGGIQWRNRSCNGPFYGGAECDGAFNDSQVCNTLECPSTYVSYSFKLMKIVIC